MVQPVWYQRDVFLLLDDLCWPVWKQLTNYWLSETAQPLILKGSAEWSVPTDPWHSACEPEQLLHPDLWIRSCFCHPLCQFVWHLCDRLFPVAETRCLSHLVVEQWYLCQGEREGKIVTHCTAVFKENMTAISHECEQTTLPKKNVLSWIHRLA